MAGVLETAQHQKADQIPDVQAVGGRIEAHVHPDRALRQPLLEMHQGRWSRGSGGGRRGHRKGRDPRTRTTVCRDDWAVQTVVRQNGQVVAPPPSPEILEPREASLAGDESCSESSSVSSSSPRSACGSTPTAGPPTGRHPTNSTPPGRCSTRGTRGTEFEEFDGAAAVRRRGRSSICENAIGSLPDARLADSGPDSGDAAPRGQPHPADDDR